MEECPQQNPICFADIALQKQEQAKEQDEDEDSDFEFDTTTPGSPTSDPNKNSPADFLFFNGRLLPHSFPFQSFKNSNAEYYSPSTTSRTSSIGSKDSFMSSRSNSCNSRSSCSSARTSSSEYRHKTPLNSENVIAKATIAKVKNPATRPARLQRCASSPQRWQLIRPAPILSSSTQKTSCRKKTEAAEKQESRSKKQVDEVTSVSSWFGLRLFRWFMSMCRECHALEPSRK